MHPSLRVLILVISVLAIAVSTYSVHARPAAQRRDLSAAVDDISILNGYVAELTRHAGNLHILVKEPASNRSTTFEQESTTEASGFLVSLRGFQDTLAQPSADKVLANYDLNNSLMNLLKNVISLNKNTLTDIQALTYQVPILRPAMGPIVEEIAEILEDILATAENLGDAILNGISPLLRSLISVSSQTT